MKTTRYLCASLLVLCLCLAVTSTYAQEQFTPEPYQEGKDVVWVPTPQELVEKMLDIAKVTPEDFVMDLGSGDGRTVITAAKRGARALGVEYNPKMVELSRKNAEAQGVSDKAKFIEADLFETDFSDATVITMFLLTSINIKLRPKLLDLKPGTRIVSNTFTMEEWEPDEEATADVSGSSYDTALLWIVPAKVGGTWQLPQGKLTLKQEFQMFSGTLESNGSTTKIDNSRLNGDQISFSAGRDKYTGRVNGKTMEGTSTSGGTNTKWKATLVSD